MGAQLALLKVENIMDDTAGLITAVVVQKVVFKVLHPEPREEKQILSLTT